MPLAIIEESLIVSNEISPGVSSWTLASRAAHMLREAEKMYGKRQTNILFCGIEFQGKVPHIWYPGGDNAVIRLTPNCMQDIDRAYFQLSVEIAHLLTPVPGLEVNNLEEGMTVYFGERYCADNGLRFLGIGDARYVQAREAFGKLMKISDNIIIEARNIRNTISRITPDDLETSIKKINAGATIDRNLLNFLCDKFPSK